MKIRHFSVGRIGATLALAFAVGFGTGAFQQDTAPDTAASVYPVAMAAAEPAVAAQAVSDDEPASRAAPEPEASAQDHATAAAKSDVARDDATQPKILVSLEKRHLWLVLAGDTLLSAPVAVGMNKTFEFEGKRFHFSTPRGTRRVLKKEENPVWTVPVWHYYERAKWEDLDVVFLEEDSRITLDDGTLLVVEGDQVGRINHFGNFWPITPGNEIIFDGKVFVPPMSTQQRRVPDALGPYKLDTGDGYLIHGTHIHNEDSVGRAVSHGCVRMSNADLERLYWMVEPGTRVVIF